MPTKYNFDVSATSYDRLAGIKQGTAQLSDGTLVFLRRNGTATSLTLSYATGAFRGGFTDIFVAVNGGVAASTATLVVDNADNIYVFWNANANPGYVRAFVKGAGLTWTAQPGVTYVLAGTTTYNHGRPVWVNTGGGANGKGHIVVSYPSAANSNQLHTLDAGRILAGDISASPLVDTKNLVGPNVQPSEDNTDISADGFGATNGLFASSGATTGNGVNVQAWSVSNAGILTITALGTITGLSIPGKVRLARIAANTWLVVYGDPANTNKLSAAKYSATAQLTGPTTYAVNPTNWPNLSVGATVWDLGVDPSGNKAWVHAWQAAGNANMLRLGVSGAAGIAWDASVVVADTLGVGGTHGQVRVVREARNSSILDVQAHEFSSPSYMGEASSSQFNQPPNVPGIVTPGNNITMDLAPALTVQWTFTDPDAGNTQSGVYIRRSTSGGQNEWWTGAAWVSVETKIAQAGQSYTFPIGAWANNNYYDWAVATEDNNNAKSAYSAVQRLQGLPPAPTSDTPSAGATVATDVPTLTLVRASSPISTKGRWQLATDAGFTTNVRLITEPDTEFSSSGTATEDVPSASQLFQGTWYVRAAVVDQNGTASAWTAGQAFTVSHPPATGQWVPKGGVALDYGGAGAVTLDWDFSDTSPVDTQTAYQVILERNDTGATIFDTGKVASTATLHTFNLAIGNKDVVLRWKVRVWDSDDVVGPYSAYNLFIVQDAPTVVITYPADAGTANNPAPTIAWTATFGAGRAQREYHVTVTRTSDSVVVHDSGWRVSTSSSYAVTDSLLTLGTAYTVRVEIRDTNYLVGRDTNAFVAAWTPPAGPPKTIADLYDSLGYVQLAWQDTARDPSFISYRVYRRKVGNEQWLLLAEFFTTQANYEYRDYLAESTTSYEYDVVQMVDRFGSLVESTHAAVTLTPTSSDYWIIYSNDPDDWYNNLRLYHATSDTPVEEYQREAIPLIGRGRHYDFGERLGFKGSLTCEILDQPGLTARQQILQLRQLQEDRRSVWLRNPFGDIWQVVFEDIPFDRMPGVGVREFGNITMPYVEVAD